MDYPTFLELFRTGRIGDVSLEEDISLIRASIQIGLSELQVLWPSVGDISINTVSPGVYSFNRDLSNIEVPLLLVFAHIAYVKAKKEYANRSNFVMAKGRLRIDNTAQIQGYDTQLKTLETEKNDLLKKTVYVLDPYMITS